MKMVATSTNYCVMLTVPQFKQLDSMEYLDDVLPPMKAAGAMEIEFNGHFGPNVFFTAEPKDAQRVLDTVRRLINSRGARPTVHPSQHRGTT